tara:strand:+ start:15534 stop:16523 length:990 start_codon:yes stop_codon:yes gene_type:complete
VSSLYVDFISPRGHKTINSFYVDGLKKEDYLLCKKNYLKKDCHNGNKLIFSTFSQKETQGVFHIVEQLLLTMFCFVRYFSVFRRVDNIVFLSYNPVWNSVLIVFLRKFLRKEVYVIEHNSIPTHRVGFKGRIKTEIFSFVSGFVTHLVYEDYIGYYLKDKFNSSFITVHHPIISSCSANFDSDSFIFSPSASTSSDINNWLMNYCLRFDMPCLIKSETESTVGHIECRSRFENYDEIMNMSGAVVIGADFENRVSGVFYEALNSPKFIFLYSSKFSRYVCDKYPNVHVFSDDVDLGRLLENYKDGDLGHPLYYDTHTHNQNAKLNKVIK